jgi:hypothetical protein
VVLLHPVVDEVNINVELPTDNPVTRPALLTEAISGLLLTQFPPLVGDKVVVLPINMVELPVISNTGGVLMTIVRLAVVAH